MPAPLPTPNPTPANPHRILCSRETAERLKKRFPGASFDEAIEWLLAHDPTRGDVATCATIELGLTMDRLAEVLSLLALTNIDLADIYRRQVGGELLTQRQLSAHLADLVVATKDGEKAP